MASNLPKKLQTTAEKEARLAGLYDIYFDKIAHYAYARTGNRTTAEDIAGEVFLKALASLSRYEERGLPMEAWLFKIAHNQVVDYLREASKTRTVPIEDVEIIDKANPQITAEITLEMERVTNAMEELTEEQADIIKLRFLGGLTSKEVGSIVGKNDGAVREMLRAAMEKMRKLLNVKVE